MLYKEFFNTLSEKKIVLSMFIYIFILLSICSHMSPLYYTNEWADVNIYFNIGKAIFNGKILYTEVFDHKGPLIFFIYGLGYLISNDSFLGVFLIQYAVWCVMLYYVYKLSKLYLDKIYAFFITIIFSVFILKLFKAGGSAEEFILVLECISLYYFVKYFKEKVVSVHKPSTMFLHGSICSMVLLTKLNLIVFWSFPIAGIFLSLLLKKEFKNILLNAFAFIGGFLLIAMPIGIYLYTNDALVEAYNIYVELNRKYANIQEIGETIRLIIVRIAYLFLDPLSLLLMLPVGAFYFPIKYIGNTIGKYALILSSLSLYVVIVMSPVFQMYYPIVLLVFSALGVLSLFLLINRFVKIQNFSFSYIIVFLTVFAYISYGQKDLSETKMAKNIIKINPGMLTQKLHDEIIKEENPTLMNLGFGLGNSLFTTCNIVPSVRYFVTPNLTYESYPDMRNEQTRCIVDKEVKFILMQFPYSNIDGSTKIQKRRKIGNQKYFLSLPAFQENYNLILSDTIINSIDENSIEVYNLYKLKN